MSLDKSTILHFKYCIIPDNLKGYKNISILSNGNLFLLSVGKAIDIGHLLLNYVMYATRYGYWL